MHLEVNQRLQEVASHKRDKYFPQEIDMALNKAMFRLLEDAVEKQFQDTQIQLSHVAGLIKKNKINEVIIPTDADTMYQDNVDLVYSVTPPDFYWLVNARVETLTDLNECEEAPTLATKVLQEWVAVVPFTTPQVTSPYYGTVTLTSTLLGTLYTAPTSLRNVTNLNDKYLIIQNMVEYLWSNTTVRVYYERYRDVYYPDSVIVVGASNIGSLSITGGLSSTVVASAATSYTTYNRALISAVPNVSAKITPCKTGEEDDIYSALRNNIFYDTDVDEVLLDQTYDYFINYRKESFLVTRLYFDYIRKPKSISLVLGQNCELADTTHNRIVDLAVEILRLDTKDQAYPQTVQDIELRTS